MIKWVTAYTTCTKPVAEVIKNKTFSMPAGYLELYFSQDTARKMAHPGDEYLLSFSVPIPSDTLITYQFTAGINVKCDDTFPNNFLQDMVLIKKNENIPPSGKCVTCKNPDKFCIKCKDNPRYSDYPHGSYYMSYVPVCPKGNLNCVCDPAYIKYHYPKWYKDLYGDMTPEEAAASKCDIEDENCFDDEDK